jgi:hypothetical protein
MFYFLDFFTVLVGGHVVFQFFPVTAVQAQTGRET